jgi:F0F1-type ATP synthase membrane subunit b/b'
MSEVLVNMPMAHAALIDLDATWPMQIGLFLLTYTFLTLLFFKPYIALLRERDAKTRGLRDRAADLLRRAREAEAGLEARLSEARGEAVRVRRALAEDGLHIRDRIVETERTRVQADIDGQLVLLEAKRTEAMARVDAIATELSALVQGRLRSADGRTQ